MIEHSKKYPKDRDIQKWSREGKLEYEEAWRLREEVKAIVDRNDTFPIYEFL